MLRKIINRYNPFKDLRDHLHALRRESRELVKANVFRDSIIDVDWVKSKSFSCSGAAANYSFLYILFRILNDLKPESIIEFGMGQTSKLTSQYIEHNNQQASLLLVEHDANWIALFKHYLQHIQNVEILHLKMVELIFKGYKTCWYEKLLPSVVHKKFDLIINDGPDTSERYSRSGILELIPHNLADRFVFIIDDCDRVGGKETADEIMKRLSSHKIQYDFSIYKGIKEQYIIYSPDLGFLKML